MGKFQDQKVNSQNVTIGGKTVVFVSSPQFFSLFLNVSEYEDLIRGHQHLRVAHLL